jgi:hypothetical protein
MPRNEFSAEQTSIMRQAVDSVLHQLGERDGRRREEIALIVLGVANDGDYTVSELVMHTLDRLEEMGRRRA